MPTSFRNLLEMLEARSSASPDKLAFTYLVDGERTEENLTYATLAQRAREIGALLQGHAKPGARIVLLYPPGLDYVVAFFGCLYGGFVAVPAYPPDPSRLNRTLPRLQAIVDDAGADIVLTTSAIQAMTEVLATLAPDLGKKRWFATDVPGISSEAGWRRPDVSPQTLAFLQYTSGSTGMPKGVMLTHENLLANERMIREVFKLTSESVGVGWLPLYHDMGLIGNVLQTIYTGFRCILMSPLDFLHRPVRWLEAISRYGGTASGGPNFSYDLCVRKVSREEREHLDLKGWKLAFSGAEPVRPDTIDLFARTFAECGFQRNAFLPCYGLAEASLLVSGKTMGSPCKVVPLEPRALEEGRAVETDAANDARTLVSTGPAVAGTHVLVVDPTVGRPCPEGRVGEVWVAGPHVAIGYWNDAEKTERAFGARLDPSYAPALAGTRFLRTGDLGFFHRGELYISGRLKDLIIIRGRNHYPQDIERVVEESYPTLRRGCGAAFSVEIGGEERLVVTVEVDRRSRTIDRRSVPPSSDDSNRRRGPDRRATNPPGPGPAERTEYRVEEVFEAIRRAIAQSFSLHVHAIVLLKAGSIPKTSSGKIQRHACRAGYLEQTLEVLGEHVDQDVPLSYEPISLEQVHSVHPPDRLPVLLDFVRMELARVLRVSPDDVDLVAPLNGLGLDSLMAVELNHAVERSLGVVLPVTTFLRDGSGADLAEKILSLMQAAPSSISPPRSSRPPTPEGREAFALSSGQEALWFLHQLAPNSGAYNIAAALRIRGALVPEALESALRILLQRHPALHTTYAEENGRPLQVPRPSLATSFALERVDATRLSRAQVDECLAEAANRPFDLANGPVFRTILLVGTSPNEHTIVLAAHHIAADLWSIVMLLSELQLLYPRARTEGSAAMLPLASTHYRDFVEWQESYLQKQAEVDWAYWSSRLADASPLDLPTDRPRPAVQTYRGASLPMVLTPEQVRRLTEFAKSEGATVYVVLLAAFQLLLARYSGQSLFLVGSPVAGRPRAAFDRTVGYFVNPLPMRADLRGRPTGREFVRRVREEVLGALEHQSFPFTMSVKRSQLARDPSRSPLFQAMFVLEKAYLERESDLTMLVLDASDGVVDLAGLELRSERIPRRAAQFDLTLNLAQAGASIAGTIDYNTDLFDADTVARMVKHYLALVDALTTHAESGVERFRVMAESETQRLAEEWNATDAPLARGTLHGLFEAQAVRTPNATALVDGTTRLTYRDLNERANALAQRIVAAGVKPENIVAVMLERRAEIVIALLGVLKAGAAYAPIDPAYPKARVAFMLEDCAPGLVVTQPSLVGQLGDEFRARAMFVTGARAATPPIVPTLLWNDRAYVIYTSGSTGRPKGVDIEHRNAVAFVSWALGKFEAKELAGVLAATSICFDLSIFEIFVTLAAGGKVILAESALALPELAARDEVTLVNTVPSAAAELLRLGGLPRSVRTVNLAGEPLPAETVERLYALPHIEKVYNLYGPSEDTTYSTGVLATRGGWHPTIGRPLDNTCLYVLDSELQPVPIGVRGEIYLAGACLARGYLRRPALTAERFIPNPFPDAWGGRLYRTGDVGRRLPDGQVEYVGRADHQVKVRGFRIELGEIESQLRKAGAQDVVVVVREDVPGDKRVVAYVVSPTASVEALRARLKESLPEYMVPSHFVLMGKLPLTPNGKLDRKSLPRPEQGANTAGYAEPTTPGQQAMCRIAADLLRVSRVGLDDDFFELGGHSLLATQFASRVRSELHLPVNVRALFENPTIRKLAAAFLDPTSEEGEI